MQLMISMARDEIRDSLPYQIIDETARRSIWNTGRRKRLFAERFTNDEQETCASIITQAKQWVHHGCPENTVMHPNTLKLWFRLAEFCCCLN